MHTECGPEAAQWVLVSFRPLLLIAFVVLVGACAYDGPSSGVRVATPDTVDGGDEAAAPGDDGTSVGRLLVDSGSSAAAAASDPASASGTANGSAGGDASGRPDSEIAATALPASVAVVGDSLTLSAQDEIETALSTLGVDVIAIDGVESRRMASGGSALPPGTEAVDAIVDAGVLPEVWIVALGTNDVGAQVSASAFADDVAAVLRRIPAGAPVIWVDLWIRDRPDDVAAANRAIRSVVTLRAGSVVVDWHAWGAFPDTITGDGVHLTDRGQIRFAEAIAAAVVALSAG